MPRRPIRRPATAGPTMRAPWKSRRSRSLRGEPRSCSTSHDWATDCIHVPISETSWPPQKKRKSRWLSARSASGKGIASFPACAVPAAKARWALTMIPPGELARLMQSAAPHAVLDLRERAAYERGHIYRATSLPRRLLEFRLPALVPARATPLVICDADGRLAALALPTLGEMGYPDVRTLDGGLAAGHPETTIVVHCGGRTRSYIGAESLRRMRLANPVVALENGTMGWELAGLALERGAARWAPAPSARSRAVATLTAKRVAAEDGIPFVSPDELAARLATRERQNLYVLDVRTADEYAAGHVAGAVWAPGGQAVQATDEYVAVRAASIVLVCDGVARSVMAASWLRRMGLPDVAVLAGGLSAWTDAGGAVEPGHPALVPFGWEAARQRVTRGGPADLGSALIVSGDPSDAYAHRPVPGARGLCPSRLAWAAGPR